MKKSAKSPPWLSSGKVLAAGVSLPDVLAREGVHPETPRVSYRPGWDLVGVVDQIEAVSGFELGQTVAAMPIGGCYAQYVCLPQRKFIPVPAGLDPAQSVAAILNYITAYQMLNRSAKVKPGQRVLIHGIISAEAMQKRIIITFNNWQDQPFGHAVCSAISSVLNRNGANKSMWLESVTGGVCAHGTGALRPT